MDTKLRLAGIFSAQWLPFDSSGRLDRASLEAHLEFEKRCGVRGILALGSTGRFPHLSLSERVEALVALAAHARPMALTANVSDIRPEVAIELGLVARDLGYSAIALMPPTFYPLSQEDLLAYFLHVAGAVGLPVILYNYPELTGKRIEIETIAAVADRVPLLGIKQSGSDFGYHTPLIRLGREKGFDVATGADLRLPEAFAIGATACIGGMANFVPEPMVRLYEARGTPPDAESQRAFERLREVGAIINELTFPLNVAAGMEARGFAAGSHKAIVSRTTGEVFTRVVARLRARFAEWEIEPVLETEAPQARSGAGIASPR